MRREYRAREDGSLYLLVGVLLGVPREKSRQTEPKGEMPIKYPAGEAGVTLLCVRVQDLAGLKSQTVTTPAYAGGAIRQATAPLGLLPRTAGIHPRNCRS